MLTETQYDLLDGIEKGTAKVSEFRATNAGIRAYLSPVLNVPYWRVNATGQMMMDGYRGTRKPNGIWLFDRNGYTAFQGEAYRNPQTGSLTPLTRAPDAWLCLGQGPRAIYRWVPGEGD